MVYSVQSEDTALLDGMLSGHVGAFHVLYDRYWELLYTRTIAIVKVRQDAQDIVQDVFLSIWKRKDSLQIDGSVRGYLLSSVKFGSLAFLRNNLVRKKYLHVVSDRLKEEDLTDPGLLIEAQELAQIIRNVISQMPDRMREIYLLSRERHLSNAEIANSLGIAEATVKKQIVNALALLRSSVRDRPTASAIFLFYLGELLF